MSKEQNSAHESTATETEHEFPPVQADVKQFTFRAIFTGMLLGGTLSLCNVYLGLKIGWGFNMSITAALLGFAFWYGTSRAFNTKPFGVLENNMNQTSASAAASISSAGLVAPIPALTMLTDYQWTLPTLIIWTFSVSLVGVVTAIGLRRQMLEVDKLPFPNGVATGETLKEIYSEGGEAIQRLKMLVSGMALGVVTKIVNLVVKIKKLSIAGSLKVSSTSALTSKGYSTVTLKNLGFAVDPSLMMIAVGIIVGFRACVSMLLGAIVAWGVLGPIVLDLGYASAGKNAADAMWFGPMVKWMLWPGVAIMVTSALTSFSFSWKSMLRAFTGGKSNESESSQETDKSVNISKKTFIFASGMAF